MQTLFSPFITNFYYMFKDPCFEAGCEFKNDFLSSIYSRLFLPNNVVVHDGENFSELIMIQQGVVDVSIPYSNPEYFTTNHYFRFFVMPTFSYIGDY